MLLSIVIPVFDEIDTLHEILRRVTTINLQGFDREIILVDDGSSDGSSDLLRDIIRKNVDHLTSDEISGPSFNGRSCLKLVSHKDNQGKGAALRSGFKIAQGDVILIQDADLEYDPVDYPKLLEPIIDGRADVVFGSRFAGGEPHRVLYFWHALGNHFLTFLSNCFTNLNLTDMECCYKVFRKNILDQILLEEDRFGVEPEMTAKIAKLRCPIFEVGVSYSGRTYAEGKKIGWRDGIWAIWCILKYNVLRRG